jgi:hypothetical protein
MIFGTLFYVSEWCHVPKNSDEGKFLPSSDGASPGSPGDGGPVCTDDPGSEILCFDLDLDIKAIC